MWGGGRRVEREVVEELGSWPWLTIFYSLEFVATVGSCCLHACTLGEWSC